MRIVYSPRYHIDIGSHIFPTRKYQLLHERIRAAHPDIEVVEPEPASWADLGLVHTREYLRKIERGDFDPGELAQLEVPWSPAIVEGFRLMTGGTLCAANLAMAAGRDVICHIGGGFHHAFANHGEGFCLFNDVAIAICRLLADRSIERAAVVDLDVHHGNGTAFIFETEPRVFTFSMHQQNNYPHFKPRGSLDVGLPDRADDSVYLDRLTSAMELVLAHHPDVIFYLAGADPYRDDQLGGLALTKDGLRRRDRIVLEACASHDISGVVVLAGGYAWNIDDTVDIHYATVEEARLTARSGPPLS